MGIYFTEDHEWIRSESDTVTIGITDYAQEQLGEIVFVELPEAGQSVSKGDAIVVVESVKAASDVYAPFDGEITEVNVGLGTQPELINLAAMDGGWLWKMKPSAPDALEGLMDKAAYDEHIS